MPPRTIDRATARRFLVRRHLLAPPRVAAAGAGLGAPGRGASRARSSSTRSTSPGATTTSSWPPAIDGYRRAWTDDLLYGERWLYESYNKGLSLLPTAELPWYRISWDRFRAGYGAETFAAHADLVAELLERITRDGPLSSTDVEPRAAIDWYWRPTNQVRAVLEALAQAGVLALARRDGNRSASTTWPSGCSRPTCWRIRHTEDEQRQHKLLSRYRAHGLLGMRGGQGEVWLGTGRPGRRSIPAARRAHRGRRAGAGRRSRA